MNVAIIPARGGSKRIPRKNVRDFCGKPMIAWPIAAAMASGLFERIVVSTDDEAIAAVARAAGADVPFLRPAELSDDHTTTSAVVSHALQWLIDDGCLIEAACCLYATAAFVTGDDLEQAHALLGPDCDFAFPALRYAHPPQRGFTRGANGSPDLLQPDQRHTRTQDIPPVFHDAGQFYWGKSEAWLEGRQIFGPHSSFIELSPDRGWDIDRPEDWAMAERLFTATRSASQ